MPTPIQYPLLNGVRHSFCSIELKLNNTIFIGFKSLNYNRTRSRGVVRGNHPDPLGKTRGDNEYEADCELYLAEWNMFQMSLGAGYGDVFFQIFATYSENGFDTIQDVINGCTIDSTEVSQSQGSDPLVRKFDLSPLKILYNGVDDMITPLIGVDA